MPGDALMGRLADQRPSLFTRTPDSRKRAMDLPTADIAAIFTLYTKQDMTATETAEKTGYSTYKVLQVLREIGAQIRPRYRREKICDERKEQILTYRNQGRSLTQMAKQLECSRPTIRRALKIAERKIATMQEMEAAEMTTGSPIRDLDLAPATVSVLRANNMIKISALLKYVNDSMPLTDLNNIGTKRESEIRRALKDAGFEIGDES